MVGLGNPGQQYERTRHNAGFWFVDAVARDRGVELRWENRFGGWLGQFDHRQTVVRLFKPGQFMNRSGAPVAAVCRYFRLEPEQMMVAHDDLDFEPGVVRLKVDGGHGGHNGLRSIIDHLGSRRFLRLRIGIGRPKHGSVVDYVLGRPTTGERQAIDDAIARAVGCLPVLLEAGVEKAMNLLHGEQSQKTGRHA
ncbi:MAG TPA: aminoacyl-tRNA hydrolase [Methylothermaceae bacterium]|nr:aminoacyl-tRNA hydrolase [Methylothermaceae bacterium]